MAYKIDKGIPIPEPKSRKPQDSYDWKSMKVGDSFLYCNLADYTEGRMRVVGNAARNWTTRVRKNWKWTVRKTEDGIRIWRIK